MSFTVEKTAQMGAAAFYKVVSNGLEAEGLASRLPCSEQSMLAITCPKGILLCRLYDAAVASRLNVAAAVFSAADLPAMLEKTPVSLSEQAAALGCTADMTGEQIMARFF